MNSPLNQPDPRFSSSSKPVSENGSQSGREPSFTGRVTQWVVVIVAVALVVVPVAIQSGPQEIARWHVAGAIVKHDAGQLDAMERQIEKALAWDPHCVEVDWWKRRLEVERLLAVKDYQGALEAINQALQLNAQDARLVAVRQKILTHFEENRQFDQLIMQAETQLKATSNASARRVVLNELAYFRALANRDLDQGLQESNESLAIESKRTERLDTRGFLLFKLGRYAEALTDLDLAVEQIEEELQRIEAARKQFAIKSRSVDKLDAAILQFRKSVAVLRYHRGLVFEKLDDKEKAEKDFQRVRELGFEPGEALY